MNILNEPITDRRRQTRSRVYHYLYNAAEPKSKQDIARDLDLSLPTVYQNVSELMQAGVIEYTGTSPSAGGRPAMNMHIVSDARCAIGLSIRGHRLCFAAADLSRREIAYKNVLHRYNMEDADYVSFVAAELEKFIDENAIQREKLLGVGITIAGIVLQDGKKVFYAPTMYVRNLSLEVLLKAIPYATRVENDASSGGFAEWYGSESRRSMAFLSLADGVGGGVLVNGDIYVGDNFRSGEFGHMCIEPGGRQCACGKRGCLEAYCSEERISTDLGITLAEFFDELENGNREYAALWEDYKRHLVIGIHNIRMALDCDVVIGGELTEYLSGYLPQLKNMLIEADPFDPECNYLQLSRYNKYSSMLGAALYFIRDFLRSI